MTEKDARKLGQQAFTDGKTRDPMRDQAMLAIVGKVIDFMPLFKAWLAGWDRASLDAPLPEETQLEAVVEDRVEISRDMYTVLAQLSTRKEGYDPAYIGRWQTRNAIIDRGLAELSPTLKLTPLGLSALTVLHTLAEHRNRGDHRPYTVYVNRTTNTADYRRAPKPEPAPVDTLTCYEKAYQYGEKAYRYGLVRNPKQDGWFMRWYQTQPGAICILLQGEWFKGWDAAEMTAGNLEGAL